MPHESMPKAEAPMVIFRTRKSRWFLILPLVATTLAATVFIMAFLYGAQSLLPNAFLQAGLTFLLMAVFTFSILVILIDWYNTLYTLTDNTIEKSTGFITSTTTYLSLHDLSRIDCETGIIGHMLGFGTVVVESETSERPLVLQGVPDPHNVIQHIRHARSHVPGTDK